jgi:hypothetical protein
MILTSAALETGTHIAGHHIYEDLAHLNQTLSAALLGSVFAATLATAAIVTTGVVLVEDDGRVDAKVRIADDPGQSPEKQVQVEADSA